MIPATAAETTEISESRMLHECIDEEVHRLGFSAATPFLAKALPHGVADYTLKFYVADKRGRRAAVLIVSNAVSPRLVARSVERAQEARRALGEPLNEVVLEPLAHAEVCGLSYALWPLQCDLSSHRLLRYWQKRRLARRVPAWLATASRQTLCTKIGSEQVRSLYTLPLTNMSANIRYSAGLRRAASVAVDRLSARKLRPVTVLQHSDFWLGNILLPARGNAIAKNSRGFYVIDWAGAIVGGHPFVDLLRFCRSMNFSTSRLRSEVVTLCRAVECELVDAVGYALAGLGVLGMQLEHFPESDYLAMCENVIAYLSAAV